MLRSALGDTIEIVIAGEADLWLCAADHSQVESALLNLAINARDAMADGGRLTIETRNIYTDDEDVASQDEVDPGDYVMLGVADTGSGIASETLKHVSEPFFTTKGVGKGSGLGLRMVYGFAKQSGGTVTIENELGVGTTVGRPSKIPVVGEKALVALDEHVGLDAIVEFDRPISDLRQDAP